METITMTMLKGHAGMVDSKALQGIEARLTKIEGQIRGIRGMVADGRECVDIVAQIAAVRGALKKVADLMVADHVETWLSQARTGTDGTWKQDVDELLKVFNQFYR